MISTNKLNGRLPPESELPVSAVVSVLDPVPVPEPVLVPPPVPPPVPESEPEPPEVHVLLDEQKSPELPEHAYIFAEPQQYPELFTDS